MSEPTSTEEPRVDAPAVEAVVFDVGRVIVQWQLRHLVAKVIDDESEIDWVCDHVITEHWHFQHDAGRPLSEMIPERKALFPSYAEVIDHYAANFTDSVPGRVPGTDRLIEKLVAKDVPLFAITNFGADFWQQFLPTEPLLGHMRDIVVSGVERVAKPDPRIFRLAEKRFGFVPEAMLFIDDNAANVAGAQALGWRTHHFTAAEALEAELAAHGLI